METKTLKFAFYIPSATTIGEWLHVAVHTDMTYRTEPTDTATMLACRYTHVYKNILDGIRIESYKHRNILDTK